MKVWAWTILRPMHRSTVWVIRSVKWWLLPGSSLMDYSKHFQIYELVSWKPASRGCKPVSSVSTVVGKLISNMIHKENTFSCRREKRLAITSVDISKLVGFSSAAKGRKKHCII